MTLRTLLDDYFEDRTAERGLAYFKQGKICEFSIDTKDTDEVVKAQVQGSRPNPYAITLFLFLNDEGELDAFEADCSCPMLDYCKHIAAVIYKLVSENYRPGAVITNEVLGDQKTGMPAVDGHTAKVMKWLQAIEKLPTSKAEPQSAEAIVVYTLRLETYQHLPTLSVKLQQVQLLKKGGFSQPRGLPSAWEDKKIPLADAALLGKLHYSGSGDDFADDNRFDFNCNGGNSLLQEIIQTGRCFWLDVKTKPLILAEPRKIHYEWITDNKLRQHFSVGVQPTAEHTFFIGDTLWYFDTNHYQIGPAKDAVNISLITKLLDCPRISPKQLDVVAQFLKPLFAGTPVPVPVPFEQIETVTTQPIPQLTIHAIKPNHTPKTYILGELKFRYGKKLIAWDEKQEEFYTKQKNSLTCYQRHQETEDQAIRLLKKKDVSLLGYDGYINTPKKNLFLIEKADETQEPIKLASLLKELKALDWEIINGPSFAKKLDEKDVDWYLDVADGNDWFDVEIGVSVGENKVNLIPLLEKWFHTSHNPEHAYRDEQQIPIRINNDYILHIPYKRIKLIVNTLLELNSENNRNHDQMRLSRYQLSALAHLESKFGDYPLQWKGSVELQKLSQKLRHFQSIEIVDAPKNLQAELRPYQNQGLSWLQFLREYAFGGILADDMGLGKTIQTIAHLLVEKNQGRLLKPSLIVGPTSLINNWHQELQRFSPELSVLILHGNKRKEKFEDIVNKDIVLTTYSLLPRDAKELKKQTFYYVILDEAQAIKNPSTQAAKLLQEIVTEHRLCLTGTPIENHLGELWSLFHFLMPGFLGPMRKFNELYRTPIEKRQDKQRLQLLNSRVSPFILRRKKEEVAKELPPVTEIVHSIELEGDQRDLYESIRLSMHEKVKSFLNEKGLARSQIIILDALLKLRQVCCDPRLLSLETAANLTTSAKFELLFELIPELVEENRRILLFSSFTSMLALIEEKLVSLNIPFVKLTGSTKDRATPIQRFQSGEVPLFLISLKAGGTGLNLTAADVVIHYDPWWNPSAEAQATARAHRIGQDKPVFVYKLITKSTVEEKISHLQNKKRALVESLLAENDTKSLKLTLDDLSYLFDEL